MASLGIDGGGGRHEPHLRADPGDTAAAPYSTFEQLTEEEIRIRLERLEEVVAANPDAIALSAPASMLVLERI